MSVRRTGAQTLPFHTANAPAPRQRSNEPEQLLTEAQGTKAELAALAHRVAERTGGDIYDKGVRIKSMERIHEKATKEYEGRFDGVLDIAAVALVYPSVSAAYEGARALVRHAGERVLRFRDRIETPTPVGYSDLTANVVMANGHIDEVQLHVAPMLEAKAAEQRLYTLRRSVMTTLTPGNEPLLNALHGASTAVFEIAQASLARGRQLTAKERAFIRDLTDPTKYTS